MLLRHIPTVEFNPANRAHRLAVSAFMKRNAWADSPIRFTDDPAYGSVAEQVRVKLLQWYIDRDVAKSEKAKKSPVIVKSTRSNPIDLMGLPTLNLIKSKYPDVEEVRA